MDQDIRDFNEMRREARDDISAEMEFLEEKFAERELELACEVRDGYASQEEADDELRRLREKLDGLGEEFVNMQPF